MTVSICGAVHPLGGLICTLNVGHDGWHSGNASWFSEGFILAADLEKIHAALAAVVGHFTHHDFTRDGGVDISAETEAAVRAALALFPVEGA